MPFNGLYSRFILLAALAAGILPCSVRAAPVYDGFGYLPGENLNGQSGGAGWAAPWLDQGGLQTLVSAPGLGFGSLAATPGAATTTPPPPPPAIDVSTYSRLLPFLVGADNTTLYLSFLLRPESNSGFYGGLNLGGLFIGKSGPVTTYSLEGGAVGNIAPSLVVAQADTTVLLVLRARFLSGLDTFDLFVNPEPGDEPAGVQATLDNFDFAQTNFLYINNAGGWTIDEIRLGSTFAEVTPTVPVPSPLLLVAGGLVAVGLARRRARRQL